MSIHSGMSFSTLDEDNDASGGGSCSNWYGQGGNQFRACLVNGQNLNGLFGIKDSNDAQYMYWYLWNHDDPFIKTSRMMFRSINQ